ncbi:cytochrome P450 736A117-like [Andrographis paniculata]|uniref:cytochrome P450 736A117-like n=1 Tax=Andrographis paniculata TaxID=175694 RepID=UPI0021E87AC9|nr:cytochrome P450 736A117-like [Andrographis paniculata]
MEEFLLLNPFLCFLTAASLLAWFVLQWRRINQHQGLQPPSPPRLPILGNLHQLSPLTHRSFHALGAKYGPIMLLHLGRLPVIIVQSSAAAAEIMKTHDLVFADKPGSGTMRKLFYNHKDISVAPYGEYWRKLKSICILQLLSCKRVQSFHFIREEEIALLVEKIKACCRSSSPVNLSELFTSFTYDVICRASCGRKYSEGEDGWRFPRLLTQVMELVGSMNVGEYVPWLWWIDSITGFNRRVNRVAKEVDEFLEMVIQDHLNSRRLEIGESGHGNHEDSFVGILHNIYADNIIDRDGIKAIILDMFAGGTETAAAALEWTMTELLRHPNVMNKLKCEVRAILKDKNHTISITNDDLEQMHYLRAVVKETLRIHPPIAFMSRLARQDVKVMGYDIPAGTMVILNAWAVGRDPASWDEPDTFKPERFVGSSIDFKGVDFELIPFGAGRRGCPGIGFAMANIELVLANLINKFEWELPNLEGLDTTEQPGVTTHRKNPLFAVATELRLNSRKIEIA